MGKKDKVGSESAEEGGRFVCGMTGFFEFSRFRRLAGGAGLDLAVRDPEPHV